MSAPAAEETTHVEEAQQTPQVEHECTEVKPESKLGATNDVTEHGASNTIDSNVSSTPVTTSKLNSSEPSSPCHSSTDIDEVIIEDTEMDLASSLRHIQELFHQQHRVERSLQSALRNLRERVVALESVYVRVKEKEKEFLALRHALVQNEAQAPAAPSSSRRMSYISKPFGYTQELAYCDIFTMCRQYPRLLARALADATRLGTVPREKVDQLTRAIVCDLYGDAYEHALQLLLQQTFHFLSLSSIGSAALSDCNGLAVKLLYAYLMVHGQKYLENTIKPTVLLVLNDDTLNIDLMRSSSMESDAPEDMVTPGASPGGNQLLMLCGQLMRRILSSLPVLPPGIRKVVHIIAEVTRRNRKQQREEAKADVDDAAEAAIIRSIVGDFIFLHWIVKALNFPDQYGLSDHYHVSTAGRHNLQVLGTIIVKLMSGSRFTAYQQQHLASLNQFLDELEPDMNDFLDRVTAVSNDDVNSVAREPHVESALAPICLLPNDAFLLHRILATCYYPKLARRSTAPAPPPPNKPPPPASKRPAVQLLPSEQNLVDQLNEHLKTLGVVPYNVVDRENVYLMLVVDPRIRNLETPKLPSINERDLLPFYTCENDIHAEDVIRAERAIHLLITVVSYMPQHYCPIPDEKASEDLPAVFHDLAQRLTIGRDTAKATVIKEAAALLPIVTPQPLRRRNYRALIELFEARTQRHVDALTNKGTASVYLGFQTMVNDTIDTMKNHERMIQQRFRDLQISEHLRIILPKTRALRKYLARRNANTEASRTRNPSRVVFEQDKDKQSSDRNPEWVMCGGMCPVSMDGDRFLCSKCDEQLKLNLRTIVSFINKYAAAPESTLSDLAQRVGPPIDVRHPDIMSIVVDFVVNAAYEEMFVHCAAADDTFYRLVQQLRASYTTYAGFFEASQQSQAPGQVEKRKLIPFLGEDTLNAAIQQLNRVNKITSLSGKLDTFVSCRDIITNSLQSMHLFSSPDGSINTYDPLQSQSRAVGADDYMPVLAYVILQANPVRFLSNVMLVMTLHQASLSTKGFVDVLVAVKYLILMQPSKPSVPQRDLLHPAVLSDEQIVDLMDKMAVLGFTNQDITTAIEHTTPRLTAYDVKTDGGASKLLDFLTDLACLREMGYERDESIQAIVVSGHNVSRAVQFITSQRSQQSDPPA